jgi:hypothetical protein
MGKTRKKNGRKFQKVKKGRVESLKIEREILNLKCRIE